VAALTVVIPTLGRPDSLARVLDLLERQQDSPGFDVVVAADSREPSWDAVERVVDGRRYPARAVRAELPGASAARNRGWREAGSPVVLFLGDDILPTPGLVGAHLARHAANPRSEVGVLGRVRWAPELTVTVFMRWLERGFQFDYGGIPGDEAGWGRFYTANVSVKRSALEAVDGFDEDRLPFLYEDLDLAYRLHERGFRLLYEPEALGDHLHPATLDSWRRRVATLARAERAFVRKHPELDPYFHPRFAAAMQAPPAGERSARLAAVVPPGFPLLGKLVWQRVEAHFLQELAPDFMAAWDESPAEERQPSPSPAGEPSSAGRSSGGPK
jgi:GT2 family glycosyltransferase